MMIAQQFTGDVYVAANDDCNSSLSRDSNSSGVAASPGYVLPVNALSILAKTFHKHPIVVMTAVTVCCSFSLDIPADAATAALTVIDRYCYKESNRYSVGMVVGLAIGERLECVADHRGSQPYWSNRQTTRYLSHG